MRRLVQAFVDGLLTAAVRMLAFILHVSLLNALRAHVRRYFTVQHYRPVYTPSGRRNRLRF
jgi:hypothetical protein